MQEVEKNNSAFSGGQDTWKDQWGYWKPNVKLDNCSVCTYVVVEFIWFCCIASEDQSSQPIFLNSRQKLP